MKRPRSKSTLGSRPRRRGWIVATLFWCLTLLIGLHAVFAASLLYLRFFNPITTGVQIQRRVGALFAGKPYQKRSEFVPISKISPNLIHAVIAAEDGRFYQHSGIDWQQVQKVVSQSMETGEVSRGASTLTQQLVKNLFFTTHRNPVRKLLEYTVAPMATVILGRNRILELYLNVVEWGPGVFGAEAASQYHYHSHASRLDRDQAARLAACLPAPLRWRPQAMDQYSGIIETRMTQLGW
ncbi:MAG: monofunctional biosynthetic peptidoglycan transglycosylase [Acidobacteriota bacterium]